MLHNNIAAFLITLTLSILWLRFVGYAVIKGWISNTISRKIIHIGTGPLFVICWLLFDSAPYVRFLAVTVPLISTIQFGLAGLGIIKDRSSVESMSRSGAQKELLKGPFLYGLVFIGITLVFWRTTPVGVIALMVLCGGDGLADIFGKCFGKATLPWATSKTWAGSIAMFVGGILLSLLIIWVFDLAGIFAIDFNGLIPKLFVVSLISTLVEAISKSDIDNFTVPLAAVLTGLFVQL